MTTKTGATTKAPSTASATGAPRTKRKSPGPAAAGEVAAAVAADLAQMPADLAKSALAMGCLAMARLIDNPGHSATSQTMAFGRLQEAMDRLRELMPVDQEADQLDDLARRREARRAGSAAATH